MNLDLSAKFYSSINNKYAKLYVSCFDIVMRIGQLQLLRSKLCYELNNAGKHFYKYLHITD
jgi:hypothetical protein